MIYLKDNYFGDYCNYKGPNEFALRNDEAPGKVLKQENAFEFSMIIIVKMVAIAVPEVLFEITEANKLKLETSELCLDLRYRPELFEVQIDVQPIHARRAFTRDYLFIKGIALIF